MILYELLSWLLLGLALAAIDLLFRSDRTSKGEVLVLGALAAMAGGMIERLYAYREPLGAYSVTALIAGGVVAIAALFFFDLARKSPSDRAA